MTAGTSTYASGIAMLAAVVCGLVVGCLLLVKREDFFGPERRRGE